jgi:GH25 family lysozyme M1 (1,4-beta-N-acetylmuramidase)
MEKLISLILLLSVPSLATYGVDVSQYTNVFSCLVQNGYTFSIIRGYMSSGYVDPNVVSNINNAWNGGMSNVDVYLFPCVPCGNPATQASNLVSALNGVNYGMIWVDVETYAWSSSLSANQNFILTMVNALQSAGANVGIYSSYYNWQSIVGLSWSGVSSLPLWYAHYDNNPSFSDFVAFGGWTSPAIKQYAGDATVCGAGVDLNFY